MTFNHVLEHICKIFIYRLSTEDKSTRLFLPLDILGTVEPIGFIAKREQV
jgi:hypothetical protein